MLLEDVVTELLVCLACGRDAPIAWEQVREWPHGALAVFETAGWIKPTVPARSVECPGCEQSCFMPVHVLPAQAHAPARAYVACDRRDDIGRVKIAMPNLRQWHITGSQVARWASIAIGLRAKPERDPTGQLLTLGNHQGQRRVGRIQLSTTEPVSLHVSGHALELRDVVMIEANALSIDRAAVLVLVGLPPMSADVGEAKESLSERAPRKAHSRSQSTSPHPESRTASELGSSEWRKQTARTAANARHDQPGGTRDKQRQIREIWATGKYSSRDLCAEEECAALGMSFSAARKALLNTPDP